MGKGATCSEIWREGIFIKKFNCNTVPKQYYCFLSSAFRTKVFPHYKFWAPTFWKILQKPRNSFFFHQKHYFWGNGSGRRPRRKLTFFGKFLSINYVIIFFGGGVKNPGNMYNVIYGQSLTWCWCCYIIVWVGDGVCRILRRFSR